MEDQAVAVQVEAVAQVKASYTGQYLAPYLARNGQKVRKRA